MTGVAILIIKLSHQKTITSLCDMLPSDDLVTISSKGRSKVAFHDRSLGLIRMKRKSHPAQNQDLKLKALKR